MLKNGKSSKSTVYDQECGIFIDEHLYIPLKISKQQLTAHEAEIYYLSLGQKIPDLYQAVRFKLAVSDVNRSLGRIGMKDFCFPSNILQDVWYKEACKNARPGEKRRCVVILEDDGYVRPEYQIIDNSYLLYESINLYHRSDECFDPVSLELVFSLNGFDFLTFTDGYTEYDFCRGKDLKLFFLGINTSVSFLASGFIAVDDVLYENNDGKLVKV